MRIAALVYLAPRKLGSLEQWVLEFVRACRRRGHDVHLFCFTPVHPAVEQALAEENVGWTSFRLLEQRPFHWGRVLRRSYDVIYTNLVVARSPGAYSAYWAWPVPILFFDGISGPVPGSPRGSRLGRLLAPVLFTRVRAVAGCSEYVAARDRRRFHLDAERCRVIYNGVDTSRFMPPPEPRGSPPMIVAVANLIPEKGIDILIRACALVQDLPWRLTIVGDGPEGERLRALAAELGMNQRTTFTGLRDDVEVVLRDADVYVHPCRWEEAFGLTIAEAMASECAVIASRIGGIPEIVEDGRSGMLVEPGNLEELVRALRGLLTDPAERRRLGREARVRAVEHFGLRTAVEEQVQWIERWTSR